MTSLGEGRVIHLVDDDEAVRHSASFLLRNAGFRVKTYADGVAFLDVVDEAEPGCILLDVQMPRMDGLEVQEQLKARGIMMPVIVLTGHGDVAVAVRAMKAGAADFVEKPYAKETLLNALTQAFGRLEQQRREGIRAEEARGLIGRLTQREREVLEGLVEGHTNKTIAEMLDISPRTVEIHRANVMEKLEAGNLSTVLRLAFAAGIGRD